MKKIYLLILLILSSSLLANQKADNLIIFKVISKSKIPSSNMEILNTSIETNLTELGYGIINENIQNEALEEQKKQRKSECYDDQCLVDTGRMLAAKKLLIIRLTKQKENKFFIKLRRIDIETGIIENSFASAKVLNFDDYDNLNNIIKTLLNNVIGLKKNFNLNTVKVFKNNSKYIKLISNPKGASVYKDKNLNSRSRLGKTPLSVFIKEGEVKKIYLVKFGYDVKEYELRYDSPNNVKLILDEAKKYQLKFNTDVDYNISYSPYLHYNFKYNKYNNYYKTSEYYQTKYFKKGQKLIYLPKGKYNFKLSKKGYKTLYRNVDLSKDTEINIKSEKEIISPWGVELISEYRHVFGVVNLSDYTHLGILVNLLTFKNSDVKVDLFRFGFLTDLNQQGKMKDIRFSMLNLEINMTKNIFYSITLGYLIGDGDIMFTTDEGEDNYFIMTPLGIKFGYRININNKIVLKIYEKTDMLLYKKAKDKGDLKSTFSIILGLSLEAFF